MTWDIARRSIDYFLARAETRPETSVTFYGGEPLVAWGRVTRCIGYLRDQRPPGDLQIVVVSNATLLDDEKVDFLVAHRVDLQVSLDGPRTVHDACRVFRDGRGTHAHVVRALERIRARDPRYFRKHVAIRATFDRNQDIRRVLRYFSRPPFADLEITIGGRTGDYRLSRAANTRHESRLDALLDTYLGSLGNKAALNRRLLSGYVLGDVVTALGGREVGRAAVQERPNGACVPGASRLFVTAAGLFYPCCNACIPGYSIGDYRTGIDPAKVRRLLKVFVDFCQEMCQECWAYRLCSQCFVEVRGGRGLSRRAKQQNCVAEKRYLIRTLRRFIYIWEREPTRVWNSPWSLHRQVRELQTRSRRRGGTPQGS
jgi:uncharacterized protein